MSVYSLAFYGELIALLLEIKSDLAFRRFLNALDGLKLCFAALERFPIRWNHLMDKKSLQLNI